MADRAGHDIHVAVDACLDGQLVVHQQRDPAAVHAARRLRSRLDLHFHLSRQGPDRDGNWLAAIRDLVSFLNYEKRDRQGNSNPLGDFKDAPCSAHHCDRDKNFDVTIMEGVSQSGRFTRDFLWQGFNADGHGRRVFNGMFPIIPGSRKTYTNFRWGQPGRWSKGHETIGSRAISSRSPTT